MSWNPRPRQMALAASWAATALSGASGQRELVIHTHQIAAGIDGVGLAVPVLSFLFTSGMTSAILDLAFCVARTWLAVTTDLVTLGSSTCTPRVSRKGALYIGVRAASGRRSASPTCPAIRKLLMYASSTSGLSSFHKVIPLGRGSWTSVEVDLVANFAAVVASASRAPRFAGDRGWWFQRTPI